MDNVDIDSAAAEQLLSLGSHPRAASQSFDENHVVVNTSATEASTLTDTRGNGKTVEVAQHTPYTSHTVEHLQDNCDRRIDVIPQHPDDADYNTESVGAAQLSGMQGRIQRRVSAKADDSAVVQRKGGGKGSLLHRGAHPVVRLGWKPLCEVHCNGLVGEFLGGHGIEMYIRCTSKNYEDLPLVDYSQGGCIMSCSQFEKMAGRELSKKWKESIHVVGEGEGSKATLVSWLKRKAEAMYGDRVVGKRVWVCWASDSDYYQGCIVAYSRQNGKHKVQYTDRLVEELHLPVELLCFAEEKPVLPGDLHQGSVALDRQEGGPRSSPSLPPLPRTLGRSISMPGTWAGRKVSVPPSLCHQGSGVSVSSVYEGEGPGPGPGPGVKRGGRKYKGKAWIDENRAVTRAADDEYRPPTTFRGSMSGLPLKPPPSKRRSKSHWMDEEEDDIGDGTDSDKASPPKRQRSGSSPDGRPGGPSAVPFSTCAGGPFHDIKPPPEIAHSVSVPASLRNCNFFADSWGNAAATHHPAAAPVTPLGDPVSGQGLPAGHHRRGLTGATGPASKDILTSYEAGMHVVSPGPSEGPTGIGAPALEGARSLPLACKRTPAASLLTGDIPSPPAPAFDETNVRTISRWMNGVALALDADLLVGLSMPTAESPPPTSDNMLPAQWSATGAPSGPGPKALLVTPPVASPAASPSARFQTLLVYARKNNSIHGYYEAMLTRYQAFVADPALLRRKMAEFVLAALHEDSVQSARELLILARERATPAQEDVQDQFAG